MMPETPTRKGQPRADGREPLFVYIDPEVILALKKLALDRKMHAYLIVEQVLREYIAESSDEAKY